MNHVKVDLEAWRSADGYTLRVTFGKSDPRKITQSLHTSFIDMFMYAKDKLYDILSNVNEEDCDGTSG